VASVLGRQQVLGLQRDGRVAATLKHYLAYSASRSGRDRTPAELSARGVRENYLPPFAAAVRAGARTVMVNSAEIDGEPVHASRYWLTDVLRGELGFTGVVVTDWEDIYYLHTRHRVAPTIKDAVRMAIDAGVDVSMTPTDFRFTDALVQLVREGAVSERRIDQSVRRILTLKEELGLFDAPFPDPALRARFATDEAFDVARRAARESITLLKNEGGILPLKADAKILVTGPAAQSMTALNGGWTYTWQGTDASQFPEAPRTVLEAILRRGRDVRYVAGSGFTEPGDAEAAARLAADADVALPEAQLRLVEAVQATGKPVVLVLVQGRPRIIRRVVDGARGIVMAYWPGMHGGEAVAEVLFGERNPSGRLPFTYPRHANELITYDHKFTETLSPGFGGQGFRPEWPFGHGLSYTTFAYADLRLGTARMDADGRLPVQVTVRNTGARAGEEAVLLYTRQHFASTTPYVRRLRGFQKVALAPGESRTLTFVLTADDLRSVDRDGRMVLEPGAFDVMVGGLSATFQVTAQAARTMTTGGR
jgi:beta-glucosidase